MNNLEAKFYVCEQLLANCKEIPPNIDIVEHISELEMILKCKELATKEWLANQIDFEEIVDDAIIDCAQTLKEMKNESRTC